LYEYDKVLTSIYRTFSIVSVVRTTGTSVSLPAF